MQDVHDFFNISLSSCGVFHFELVGDQVEPVFNLLLVCVTIVGDAEQDLNGLIEVIPGVIHFNDSPAEQGILFGEKLFAWFELVHGGVAHCDSVIIF